MASRRGGWTVDEWVDRVFMLALFVFGWWMAASVVDQFVLRPIWAVARWIGHPLGQDVRTALAFVTASELCIAYLVLLFRERRKEERARREREAAFLARFKTFRATMSPLSSLPADAVALSPPKRAESIPEPAAPKVGEVPAPAITVAPPEPSAERIPQFPGRILFLEQAVVGRTVASAEPREAPKPQPFELSRAEWDASRDPADLLRHAIPRLPVQHTGLVLAQLAGMGWPYWNRCFPEDWRPGWCLMAVRAWCLGEAERSELEAIRAAMNRARRERNLDPSAMPSYAAVRAIDCAAQYALDSEADRVGPLPALELLAWIGLATRDEDLPWGFDPNAVTITTARPDAGPPLERIAAQRARRTLAARRSTRIAERLRTWIPYPIRSSTQWRRSGSWIRAGDASLYLDGWRIASSRSLTP